MSDCNSYTSDPVTVKELTKSKSSSCPFSEEEIVKYGAEYRTPFHLYDEATIRDACRRLKSAFSWVPGFKNYFAVKATPNPRILEILKEEGFGFDCSSMTELLLVESIGMSGQDIYFTSNNTPIEEFKKAKELGAFLNLDDLAHVDFIHSNIGLPEFISFRYNPGRIGFGNVIIGDPQNAKFGMTKAQILEGCVRAQNYGVKRFGLHTMIISNCLDEDLLVSVANLMFDLAVEIKNKTGIHVETVNLGGGIGIPYRLEDLPINLQTLSHKIRLEYKRTIEVNGLAPLRIVYECGRHITGPAGVLVTRVIHKKRTYKSYLGVDASMVNLMRPSLYNAYHHMTVIKDFDRSKNSKTQGELNGFGPGDEIYDVVGSLCENNDKLATDRNLGTDVQVGDLIVVHDTGAHGHAMGFNYNGKLRSAEYLRKLDSSVVQIRRAETHDDLFATLHW